MGVGATCVGAIELGPNVFQGNTVNKGDQLGFFKFGGSTVLVLFKPNAVNFDSDLLFNSQYNVETFVLVGSQIGRTVNQ